MRRLLFILFILVAIAAIVAGVGYKLHSNSRKEAAKILEETESNMDRIIDQVDNIGEADKLKRHAMNYLKGVVNAVTSTGFVGLPIYDEKEQSQIYSRFFKRINRYRQALINMDEANPMTNGAKKSVMNSFVINCDKYLLQNLAEDESEAKQHTFYVGWSSSDRNKLRLTDDDFPQEVVEQQDSGFRNEISKFNAVDGKLVENKPDPRLKRVITERITTTVRYSQAKSIIGKQVELHMTNGSIEKGKLLGAEDTFLLLKVRMEGGSVSLRMPRNKISKIVKVEIKEMAPLRNKNR